MKKKSIPIYVESAPNYPLCVETELDRCLLLCTFCGKSICSVFKIAHSKKISEHVVEIRMDGTELYVKLSFS